MEDPGAPLRIQDLTRTIVGDGPRGGGWGFWNIRRLLVFSNIPTSGAFGKVFFRRLSNQLVNNSYKRPELNVRDNSGFTGVFEIFELNYRFCVRIGGGMTSCKIVNQESC